MIDRVVVVDVAIDVADESQYDRTHPLAAGYYCGMQIGGHYLPGKVISTSAESIRPGESGRAVAEIIWPDSMPFTPTPDMSFEFKEGPNTFATGRIERQKSMGSQKSMEKSMKINGINGGINGVRHD